MAGYGRTWLKVAWGRELAFVVFIACSGLIVVVAAAISDSRWVLEIGALPGGVVGLAFAFAFALAVFALAHGGATTRFGLREPEAPEGSPLRAARH